MLAGVTLLMSEFRVGFNELVIEGQFVIISECNLLLHLCKIINRD